MRLKRYLFEKKDHIIKRLKGLSKEEKDQLIPIFAVNNPKLESMVDWNNKNLTFDDFKQVLDYRSKTGMEKQVKKQGIKGLKPNVDYIELKNMSDTYNAYIPLTYEASKLIASKNVGGCEGRWCTAYQKTSGYWIDYVIARNITLIYLIGNDTKYALAIYPDKMVEMFDAEDSHITNIPNLNINKFINSKMMKFYKELHFKYFKIKSFVDKAIVIDAEFSVESKDSITWHDGIWKDGIWEDGNWEEGLWHKGIWEAGIWEDGIWKDGHWKGGIWKDGEWRDGKWGYGTWYDGRWKNGMWFDGTWQNGEWEKGFWFVGTWKNGIWFDGTWHNGIWEGGTWMNGLWENGTWKGGIWKGGTWKGGKDKNRKYHPEGDSPDKWDI